MALRGTSFVIIPAHRAREKMQAVVVEKYDSIDNIPLKQVPLPEVSAGHVRVKVQFASVVDEVATDVSGFTPGMPVMGMVRSGALAEFVAVPAAALQVMPNDIAPEVGASFRTNYLTSL